MAFPRISTLKSAAQFRALLDDLDLSLGFDAELDLKAEPSLASPLSWSGGTIDNRFCILPMEGWDATTDGQPTALTHERWRKFGISGAKLMWGGEAVAVREDGRANPNQLLMNDANMSSLESLRSTLLDAHVDAFGSSDGLLIGLQLTHSGRFARPNEKAKLEPRIAYRHPVLDSKFEINSDEPILSDDDLSQLVDDFVFAAVRAAKLGYEFVDVKHCHGYLGHELLSGFDRPGRYGGSFENRTRFLCEVVDGIRAEAPQLAIGTRVSIFDYVPYEPGEDKVGVPAADAEYRHAFGGDGTGLGFNLREPHQLMELLKQKGIQLVCTTAGSPYYNPHIQRPAIFPPSDGYQPPEDPLIGVARQIEATAQLKQQHPDLIFVGSGYSYLQEWLPHVGQFAVRSGLVDSIGLGRMVLSYPNLPADVLSGNKMQRKKICRTFSDCTTAPRNGLVSGCYPLDPDYKSRSEREQLLEIKKNSELT